MKVGLGSSGSFFCVGVLLVGCGGSATQSGTAGGAGASSSGGAASAGRGASGGQAAGQASGGAPGVGGARGGGAGESTGGVTAAAGSSAGHSTAGAASGGGGSSSAGGSLAEGGAAGESVGGGAGGGSAGAATACQADSDCINCAYWFLPRIKLDCYCATCADRPVSAAACRANEAAYRTVCQDLPLDCPATECLAAASLKCMAGPDPGIPGLPPPSNICVTAH